MVKKFGSALLSAFLLSFLVNISTAPAAPLMPAPTPPPWPGGDLMDNGSPTPSYLVNFKISRTDVPNQIRLTWDGPPADIHYYYGLYNEDYGDWSEWTEQASGKTDDVSAYKSGFYRLEQGMVFEQTVGFLRQTMVVGINFVSNPFISEIPTLGEVIGEQLTGDGLSNDFEDSDWVKFWDASGQSFTVAWFAEQTEYPDFHGWLDTAFSPMSAAAIESGKGYVVKVQDFHPERKVMVLGDIPTWASLTEGIVVGLNLAANAYAKEVPLGKSNLIESGFTGDGLSNDFEDSDWVKFWDASGQSFTVTWFAEQTEYPDFHGWLDTAFNPVSDNPVEPGDGYWIKIQSGHSPFEWEQLNPY